MSVAPTATKAVGRPNLAVISAIGFGPILSWGSTYYLPAVLAVPIAEDAGWSFGWLFGALSVGLVASGLVSPCVGGLIHHHGGRPVPPPSIRQHPLCHQQQPGPSPYAARRWSAVRPTGASACQGRRNSRCARPLSIRWIWACSPAIRCISKGSVVPLPDSARLITHA